MPASAGLASHFQTWMVHLIPRVSRTASSRESSRQCDSQNYRLARGRTSSVRQVNREL